MQRSLPSLALALLVTLLAVATGQPPAPPAEKPLTPEQQEKLKERDEFDKEVARLEKAGKFKEAIAAAEKMLAIERKILGNAHEDVAGSLDHIGWLQIRLEDWPAARTAYREYLQVRTSLSGKDHWLVITAQRGLADVDLYEKMTPEDRGATHKAMDLHADGTELLRQGKYPEAGERLRESLVIRRRVFGDTHPYTLQSLCSLGALYLNQAGYAEAESLSKDALAGYRKAFGDAHPATLSGMNNLATLYHVQARYAEAESLSKDVLAGYRKAFGDAHPDTLKSMNNLALLYRDQARYTDAEPLLKEALAGFRKAFGDAHPDTLLSMHNLAALYWSQGRYAEAESLSKDALAGYRKAFGDAHPDTLKSMNNLALLYRDQARYTDAEPLFKDALAGRRKALGDAHPDTLGSMNNLAGLYDSQGHYADAEPLYKEALAGYRKALGDAHPDTLLSMNNLAALYWSQARYADAEPLYKESLTGTRGLLDRSAAGQSEGQQLTFRGSLRSRLDSFLSFGVTAHTLAPDRYTEVLLWKGAAFSRRAQLRAAVEQSGDAELKQLFSEAEAVARQLANLSSSIPPANQLAAYRKKFQDLTDRKDEIDQELARKSEPFRKARETAAITPGQLARALPADTALVDFLEYTHYSPDPDKKGKWKTERRFVAYVVRNGQPVVEIELKEAKPITEAVDRWRATLNRTVPVREENDPAVVLRRKVWEPVAKHLGDAKIVLIAPDAALARLPFAALPGKDPDKYLIEEIAIAVAPVPQLVPELLEKKPQTPKDPNLLLIGDVDYDAVAGKPDAGTTARTAERTGEVRHWNKLDATRDEVVAIRDSFEERFPDGKVKMLRKAEATEAAVRRFAGKNQFLHVATHGFFVPPKPAPTPAPGTRGFEDDFRISRAGAGITHPGLLSGLVFAGANKPPQEGADDGILTALEVTELDLSGVELAVLSACETKLGKEINAEGTLGLERAFRVAGARSVVASLWKVPDRATQQLMSRFYRNLWEKKMPRLEALREAQLWMLKEGDRGAEADLPPGQKDKGRNPPLNWAAFVLCGDWR